MDEVEARLSEVKRSFTAPAIVTGAPEVWGALLPGARVVSDAPELDLAPGAHDLIVHAMTLHWADDPLGQLIQCRRALRPDGLLIAVAPGGRTLAELRSALAEAEARLSGGLAPRVAPMADIRDLGALLQRAGLAMPVADALTLPVAYASIADLARDLRAMGEGNALAERHRRIPPRALFAEAERLWRAHWPAEGGRLRATFELIFLTGWAPAPGQPQPLRPGSAEIDLGSALAALRERDEQEESPE